jgi:hypothetical protein
VHADYEWMKLYEAAVLETNSNALPGRIEDAKDAIGQRVVKNAIDEDERRAVVKTLHALAALKRERSMSRNPLCYQCKDAHDLVSPLNGKTFLARTGVGEISISLHTRCVVSWANANGFQALVPLRKRRAGNH